MSVLRRRHFLSLRTSRRSTQDDELTPARYAEWVNQYRSGRYIETARRVHRHSAHELRLAQNAFVSSLPPSGLPDGFWPRIAASLLHAEDIGQLGWGTGSHYRLISDPLASLPTDWTSGVATPHAEDAEANWGEAAAANPRLLFRRELFLVTSRLRLARLDLASASRILTQSEPRGDAALLWQLAAVWAVSARFIRDEGLWNDVRDLLREAEDRPLLSAEAGRASPHVVARAVSDPDDLKLRLALAALGMGRSGRAADRLKEVSSEPAPLLRVPHLLLQAEALRSEGRLEPATVHLREAVALAPDSQLAVAALVAALQAAGRREEAAELAADRLRSAVNPNPWKDFLTTWAVDEEPSLAWLRSLVATA